jgi:hypothetical protein
VLLPTRISCGLSDLKRWAKFIMRSPIPLLISLVALILGASSLFISLSARNDARAAIITEEEIDKRIDLVLTKKEEEYVASLYPRMELMYKGMLKPYKTQETKPTTFKELFAPMFQIIDAMSAQ